MGAATARAYVAGIARVLKPGGLFLSINQEARSPNMELGQQNRVIDLVHDHGGLRLLHRSRYWMRQGYVEEVFSTR
jgi:hypothetical protein